MAGGLLVLSTVLVGAEAANAAYICTDTSCPNGAQWAAARGSSNQNSYWGQSAGHNCTNYVAWRLIGNGVPRFYPSGNAESWARSASAKGIVVNNVPSVGAIAQWDSNAAGYSSAGHVAYVESVNGSTVTVSEDAWNGGSQTGPFRWRQMSASSPSHYIHFGGTPTGPVAGAQPGHLYSVISGNGGASWASGDTGLILNPNLMSSTYISGPWAQMMISQDGAFYRVYGEPTGWEVEATGLSSSATSISAVNMGSGWPTMMSIEGGYLYQSSRNAAGWQRASTGLNLIGQISAVNMGGTWPTVMLAQGGVLYEVSASAAGGWVVGSTGIPISGQISAVNMGGSKPQVMAIENGILWQIWKDASGWHKASTGLNLIGQISATSTGSTWPVVMLDQGGVLYRVYGDGAGWHVQSTGIATSGRSSAVYMSGGAPHVFNIN